MENNLLIYNIGDDAQAFTAGRDAVLPCHVIQPHQTHSVNVIRIDNPEMTREQLEGVDALVTNLRGVAIGVRTADCIPVLLYDSVRGAIGAAHSGWRGTVNMIAKKTIVEMVRLFGCSPSNIRAVIGPGIGFDSFQVGEEVALVFKESGFPVDRIWAFRGARTSNRQEHQCRKDGVGPVVPLETMTHFVVELTSFQYERQLSVSYPCACPSGDRRNGDTDYHINVVDQRI